MQINKIGLGTVQFGLDYGISNNSGKTSSEEVTRILNFAKEKGIDTIDTAQAYGDSENVLGMNELNGFKIVTKFIKGNHSLLSLVNSSLEKLKQEEFYGLLSHRPQEVFQDKNIWNELKEVKSKGLVKKIGFSFNDPNELDHCMAKKMIPDLVQIPYNYFDNRYLDKAKKLKNHGCEIHTRSAFLQGLFFKNINLPPDFFKEIKPLLKKLQDTFNESLPSLLLKYCINNPSIDKVIIGVENQQQLRLNIEGLKCEQELPELMSDFSEEILTPALWPK